MLKFLLFIALITTVYYMFFAKTKSISSPKNDASTDEAMIPCTQCGTYVQTKEALMRSGKCYCSVECLKDAS
ncbi:MAG: PP0621 family protein [Sulfuricurvum sp.]|uniref:PP0621 family protein n=1 Tax=Sulfuricurvum sp. TaxID=2025608 RepID=UPI002618379B|nr:PP0621 family protein [Sulfuricurvum sp.]MDD2828586.1 PP0621 family protein [Sulfuricurvum sp.]MDD4948263.1 PP0621 family protein [Sulfuricurvum sp.]